MSVDSIGIAFPNGMEYSTEEQQCWASISKQIDTAFPNCQNALISLTWFGPQIDIENGNVHATLTELIEHLHTLKSSEILAMYVDMLPDLKYNKNRFFEFAREQKTK
jgi:hypothetical protein